MKKIKSIEELPIDSTKLCCNFVNTVYAWNGDNNHDFLANYDVFIDWCIRLSVFDENILNKLRHLAKNEKTEADIAMVAIRKMRLLLHSLISAIAEDDQKSVSNLLEEVNPLISDAISHINLKFSEGAFVAYYPIEPIVLISPSWVILKSLYDLLTEEETVKIKECPACGWVFFDETKNGKRRWCNPLNCGTKDKMMRYNKRLKEQGSTAGGS